VGERGGNIEANYMDSFIRIQCQTRMLKSGFGVKEKLWLCWWSEPGAHVCDRF
jgi:hypothetical protein